MNLPLCFKRSSGFAEVVKPEQLLTIIKAKMEIKRKQKYIFLNISTAKQVILLKIYVLCYIISPTDFEAYNGDKFSWIDLESANHALKFYKPKPRKRN